MMHREEVIEDVLMEEGCASMPADPGGVAGEFIRRVEEGNLPAVAILLSRRVVGSVEPDVIRRTFAAGREEIIARGGVRGINVLACREGRWAAELTLAMLYGNGTVDTELMVLVREYGRWKVDLTR